MITNISDVLGQTQQASIEIAAASGSVSSNSNALSDGASSQASQLAELITEASSEYAIGVNVINDGIAQIETVTQQNNDAAQGSAAAAEQLSHQAIQLEEMLTRLKLKA